MPIFKQVVSQVILVRLDSLVWLMYVCISITITYLHPWINILHEEALVLGNF